ncbi:MAG: MoxR family ATPase [Chloroflexi bacterium]|nr:MoxR family ATPase [Chloroflexota bacterium]
MFRTIDDVRTQLTTQQYIASDTIATTLFLASKLEKPILAEGPAGTGKTELAKACAGALDRELIRLQCYEGIDEARALYEWEYAKQLLYTQLLRERVGDIVSGAQTLAGAADAIAKEENVFFSDRFLLARPLLKAITSPKPVVLLIDEIDRADAEFEAFLLELLSDFQVSIPELGTIKAVHRPIVILTSNDTRELSEALKRRCLFLYVGYPDAEAELAVVNLKVPGVPPKLATQVVEMVQRLRQLDLRKIPSMSETIDWAKALVELNVRHLDRSNIDTTLNVLLKYESDIQKARRIMEREGDQESRGARDEDRSRGGGDDRRDRRDRDRDRRR